MKYDTEIREEYHEIANREPMMQEAEMDLLVESMKAVGYDKTKPITLFEELILDGRNRYVAAEYVGIEPSTKEFKGTREEAEAESIRLNNARRHKSPSQKAMAAAYAVQVNRVDRDTIKREILEKNPTIDDTNLSHKTGHKCPILSIPKAAEIHSTSKRYVKNALKLLEDDIDLANAVFDGDMSLTKAMKTYDDMQILKAKARMAGDGKYTPEEIERFRKIRFVKENPEMAANILMKNERELSNSKYTIRNLETKNEELYTEVSVLRSFTDDIEGKGQPIPSTH